MTRQLAGSTSPPPQTNLFTANDPALGLVLPTNEVGNNIRKVAKTSTLKQQNLRGYLVIPVGDCASCLGNDVADWEKKAAQKRLGVIFLSSGTPEGIKLFCAELGLVSPVIFDSKEAFALLLNATWRARPYLFTKDWRLLWFDPQPHSYFQLFQDASFLKALESEKLK